MATLEEQVDKAIQVARSYVGMKGSWSADAPIGSGGYHHSFNGAGLICLIHHNLIGLMLDHNVSPQYVNKWFEKLEGKLKLFEVGQIYLPGTLLLRKPINQGDSGDMAMSLEHPRVIACLSQDHGPQVFNWCDLNFFTHVCEPKDWFPPPGKVEPISHELDLQYPFFNFVKDGVKICKVKKINRGGNGSKEIQPGQVVRISSSKHDENYRLPPPYLKRVIKVYAFPSMEEALDVLDISKILPLDVTIDMAKSIFKHLLSETPQAEDQIQLIEVGPV